MSTDTNLLGKGLIRLGILVFLFIASPILLTMGFKAFDRFTESPKIYIAYLLILVGFAASSSGASITMDHTVSAIMTTSAQRNSKRTR